MSCDYPTPGHAVESVCQPGDCRADQGGIVDIYSLVKYVFLIHEILLQVILDPLPQRRQVVESCAFGHNADWASRIAAFAAL